MISLCVPTRGRPEAFKQMCHSVLDNARNPGEVEFIAYMDYDDPSTYDYLYQVTVVGGKRILLSDMFNKCQEAGQGPIYMWLSDDMVFKSKDWDQYVIDAFDLSRDKIMLVHPDDGEWGTEFGAVGFLHRKWIDAVGYFMPPYFSFWYADTWVNEVANGIGRRLVLDHMKVSHQGIHHDQTHQESMRRLSKDKVRSLYYSDKMIAKRMDAMDQLRNVMYA